MYVDFCGAHVLEDLGSGSLAISTLGSLSRSWVGVCIILSTVCNIMAERKMPSALQKLSHTTSHIRRSTVLRISDSFHPKALKPTIACTLHKALLSQIPQGVSTRLRVAM